MDGLDAEAYDRKYTDRELVRRIARYFTPEGRLMLLVALAVLLASLVDTALPIYISRSLDTLQAAEVGAAGLIRIALGVAALGALSWAVNFVRRSQSAHAVGNVVYRLRQDAFDAVLKRDLSFYDQFPSGKVVSRVTSDTQAFSQVVVLTMDLMSQVLLVLLLIGYLFTVNALLTWMTLTLTPFIVAAALLFRRAARDTITQQRRVSAEVNAHIQETISGIGVAKTFRQEHSIYDEFLQVNDQSFRIRLRTGYVFGAIFPILSILAGAGTAALVYFGGQAVWQSRISYGEWYLFIQGIGLFWFPLTSIASFWSQFQLGLAAAERVFALLDAESKVVQIASEPVEALAGAISLERVSFRYVDSEPVLEDFSLEIRAGETLALVGHTGSGKSSIARLIARFYEYQAGAVRVDGRDIRALDLGAYRARLGMVTQTPFLFDGTVRENIRYGQPEADDDAVERAARQVGAGDWIASLADGLNTPVGERGSGLSMGQRQLVALARVLLQDPSIFILDEATASIDPLTETLIQEGLDTVMRGRTSIVIAHRLSTVRHADRIIVLRSGKIIEEGSHAALLKRGGHYAELYNTYFRHQSLEFIDAQGPLLAAAQPGSNRHV